MDVLISMTVSGLLISFVYYIHTHLSYLTHQYQAIHLKINEFELAKADIKRTVWNAKDITPLPNGFEVLDKNNKKTTYQLKTNTLFKKTKVYNEKLSENVKTLKINQMPSSLTKEKIYSIEIIFLIDKQEIVTYIYNKNDLSKTLNEQLINE